MWVGLIWRDRTGRCLSFLCCRGLKDIVFLCVWLMRERERERELGGAVLILFRREKVCPIENE